jgi:ubiquinone/menaquinone biosynthesis C-methylase UbiE
MAMATKTAKGYKGVGMEGMVATWYARNVRKDMEAYQKDAGRVAASVAPGSAVLELAPGPGYLAVELAKLGRYRLTGLDISRKFVEIAQGAAREAGVAVDFRHGDAAAMPFDDSEFDFIICRAAFKNFAEPVLALDEMHRVLRPGGRALIIDLPGDVSEETVNAFVDGMGLNAINSLLTRWAFKFMLIKRAYTKDQFRAFVSASQFETCRIEESPMELAVWLEKGV